MKIGQTSDAHVQVGPTPPKTTGTPAGAGSPPPVSSGSATPTAAAVTVSGLARSTMESSGGAEVDMKKVESVKAAIANGTFKVNPEAIADKLLSNAQEMLDRNRS